MTMLDQLSPRVLRELASALEARIPSVKARRGLTSEGIDQLADILISGDVPTIGFYRRYMKRLETP